MPKRVWNTYSPRELPVAAGTECSRTPCGQSWRCRQRCVSTDCTPAGRHRYDRPPCCGTHLRIRNERVELTCAISNQKERAKYASSSSTLCQVQTSHLPCLLHVSARAFFFLMRFCTFISAHCNDVAPSCRDNVILIKE